jgi:enoyl-CoA hydratase
MSNNNKDIIRFEKRGHVAIFTLNRPEAMNAVSFELATRFTELMDTFEADDDLWVGIVASSHSKVFCAGADLKSINKKLPVHTEKGGFAGFVNYPREKPLIACVDGMAFAGGCEIVLACDLVVASTKSQFGVPEVKRSLVAAAGGLYRLPRKLPRQIALEMLLTGDPISVSLLSYFVALVKLTRRALG